MRGNFSSYQPVLEILNVTTSNESDGLKVSIPQKSTLLIPDYQDIKINHSIEVCLLARILDFSDQV